MREDPVARGILAAVIEHVLDTVEALDPEAVLPVVLAGSVLTSPGPVREEVTAALQDRRRTVSPAADGMPGALLLARELAGRAPR